MVIVALAKTETACMILDVGDSTCTCPFRSDPFKAANNSCIATYSTCIAKTRVVVISSLIRVAVAYKDVHD